MHSIDFFPPRWRDLISLRFRECTPRILVVTDSLNYDATSDFGLNEFVATLRSATIHGMAPIVVTARFSPGGTTSHDEATQHITNFHFADATHGLNAGRYDVCFLFGIDRTGVSPLTAEANALAAVTTFMQNGKGLFATGDHEDLGAAMCSAIPRVRSMRLWTNGTPDIRDETRLSTNLPGPSDSYEFEDQQDAFPQRLYANYRTRAGGLGFGHPVLQLAGKQRAIEVFPDHPHEGECVVPTDLNTKLADGTTDEWPTQTGTATRVGPEPVAKTMSHGNGFTTLGLPKAPLEPRAFIAICAYDGHLAGVGRVVTDATWHHFVNVNVSPTKAPLDAVDLEEIRRYYVNLATWLMPKHVRLCLRFPWVIREILEFSLLEELRPIPKPFPGPGPDPTPFLATGEAVIASLAPRSTPAELRTLLDDALEDALGQVGAQRLSAAGERLGEAVLRNARFVALGAVVQAGLALLDDLDPKARIQVEPLLEKACREVAGRAVRTYLTRTRDDVSRLDSLLDALSRDR